MKPVRALFALALPAVFAGAANAQVIFDGNEVQLSAGGSTVWIYNSPSVGGTTGAPILGADLAYKGVPQDRTRAAAGTAGIKTLEDIFLGDVEWPGGAPDFYDIAIDTASAEFGLSGDNLIPDFFGSGSVAALLSLGNSGFPHPCVASPTSTCSGSAACPPLVTGYIVDVVLGSPLPIPALSTPEIIAGTPDLVGTQLVQFLPGGMTFTGSTATGLCGNGDYVFMGAQSLTENQADYLNQPGTSWCEGFQLGDPMGISPTGPLEDANTTMLEVNFGLIENVIEPVVSDTVIGFGPERGGAGLGVSTGSGGVTLALQVTCSPDNETLGFGTGSLPVTAVALSQLPAAFTIFGAGLMISPDGTFSSTLTVAPGPVTPVDESGDGVTDQCEYVGPAVPVAAGTLGTAYIQGFLIQGFGPISAVETTVWRIDFLP